jgi:hypothetical protein
MMLATVLMSLVATNVAVAVLFVMVRRHVLDNAALTAPEAAAEVEETLLHVRREAEEAVAEISRQKTHLRSMLADLGPQPAAATTGAAAMDQTASFARQQDIVKMAQAGMTLRGIAARSGLSLEEVRLTLAMAGVKLSA